VLVEYPNISTCHKIVGHWVVRSGTFSHLPHLFPPRLFAFKNIFYSMSSSSFSPIAPHHMKAFMRIKGLIFSCCEPKYVQTGWKVTGLCWLVHLAILCCSDSISVTSIQTTLHPTRASINVVQCISYSFKHRYVQLAQELTNPCSISCFVLELRSGQFCVSILNCGPPVLLVTHIKLIGDRQLF